ncbi:MAG: PepSY-associated TM helix domain-containing protein [Nostoc sp.]|uniref:PepSY-associated TM helix domain-containing protein n=1 Tax=Nostoc sp. TaxID=1180 RepID=UPI002FF541CC
MNAKTVRNFVFKLHRYIGLVVGVLLIIVGLTGSLLVFTPEIDEFLLTRQIGHVIPSEQRVSIESVLDTVKAAYSKVPELKVQTIYTPKEPDAPYQLNSGFKIKWKNAHPKRVNFDIHKVAGIIAAVFLALTGFTGFYLNFRGFVTPIIYAITFTPNPPDPVSQPIAGSTALSLTQLLQKADAALPNTVTTAVYLPQTPEAAIYIRKKYSHEEAILGRSGVYLDQYTGKTIQIEDALKKSLGDKVLDSFIPLHFGTFGGLPTRILYVFVGLAPLILFVTGFVMWWYRYQAKTTNSDV